MSQPTEEYQSPMGDQYRCIETVITNLDRQVFTEGRVYINHSFFQDLIVLTNDFDEVHPVQIGEDATFLNEHFVKVEPVEAT